MAAHKTCGEQNLFNSLYYNAVSNYKNIAPTDRIIGECINGRDLRRKHSLPNRDLLLSP